MREWRLRSIEEANLLNPAFLGLVIRQSVMGYCEVKPEGSPYPIPFLAVPLALHKGTRKSLPKSVATKFATWITRPEGSKAKIGFPQRATGLNPYVRESILFLCRENLLSIEVNTGLMQCSGIKINLNADSDEVKECFKASHFAGRWLAEAGQIETTMALLGVRP